MRRATKEEMAPIIARDPLKGADVFGVPSLSQCYYGDCFESHDCDGECLRDRHATKLSLTTGKSEP